MMIALSFTESRPLAKVSIRAVLGAALHITNKVAFDIQKLTCSGSLCQVIGFILPQMPFLFSWAQKHFFRKCSHSGKIWENFPFGFKLLFHVTHSTLVLKDPERIHLLLHCFLSERHEELMNDCDEEDTPQRVEKISNTKLKEEQNTGVNSVFYRKGGKKPNTFQENLPTNKSFWVCL